MTVLHRITQPLSAAALGACLLLAPLAAARADAPKAPATPLDRLWQAQLTDPAGKPVSLDAYRGQTLVVNFWASWCNPCVREMPALDKMSRTYAKKGVHFVGIAIDSPQNVQKFTQKVKVGYPLLVGGFGGDELMRRLGNGFGGLPFTIVIDKQGAIRVTHIGELQPDQLAKQLNTL